jgi:dipeptidyl aminopeptidase/acylaminoacyl peptidase
LTYGVAEARALSALLDELELRGLTKGKVGVYGFSYGGAVAIQLAARDPRVGAVVAVSSFSSLERVVSDYVRRYVPLIGGHFPLAAVHTAVAEAGLIADFDPRDADTADVASRLHAPLLLMHGDHDTQVPAYHSQRLKRAAGPRARLILVPGETHASMNVDATGTVARASVGWFDRWLV